jgi:hypothetical protein
MRTGWVVLLVYLVWCMFLVVLYCCVYWVQEQGAVDVCSTNGVLSVYMTMHKDDERL